MRYCDLVDLCIRCNFVDMFRSPCDLAYLYMRPSGLVDLCMSQHKL